MLALSLGQILSDDRTSSNLFSLDNLLGHKARPNNSLTKGSVTVIAGGAGWVSVSIHVIEL